MCQYYRVMLGGWGLRPGPRVTRSRPGCPVSAWSQTATCRVTPAQERVLPHSGPCCGLCPGASGVDKLRGQPGSASRRKLPFPTIPGKHRAQRADQTFSRTESSDHLRMMSRTHAQARTHMHTRASPVSNTEMRWENTPDQCCK